MRWKYWLMIKGKSVTITMSDDMTIKGIASDVRLSNLKINGRTVKVVLEVFVGDRWVDIRTVKAIDTGEAV